MKKKKRIAEAVFWLTAVAVWLISTLYIAISQIEAMGTFNGIALAPSLCMAVILIGDTAVDILGGKNNDH